MYTKKVLMLLCLHCTIVVVEVVIVVADVVDLMLLTPGDAFLTCCSWALAHPDIRVYSRGAATQPVRQTERMVFTKFAEHVKIRSLQCYQRFAHTAVDTTDVAVTFVVQTVLSPRAIGRMVLSTTMWRAILDMVYFTITCGENNFDFIVYLRIKECMLNAIS